MGYRIVRMSADLFEQLFTEGYTLPTAENTLIRVTKGLPEGAKLVGMSMNVYFAFGDVALKFSHPSWDGVPAGDAIPEQRVEFTMQQTTEFRSWHFDKLTPDDIAELRAKLYAPQLSDVPDDAPHVVEG